MATATDRPDWKSPEVQAMEPRWTLCRDVRGGTETIRKKSATYLPRFLAEDLRDYAARVDLTVVVDFFDQAVNAFVGLGLRSDPELGANVPPEIAQDWEDLDGEGNHGAVMFAKALDAMLTDGLVLFLAEYPPVDQRPTRAEEVARGLRPYAVMITVDQLRSWRTKWIGGERVLSQLVFATTSQEPDGAFGSKAVTRYWVYRLDDSAPEAPQVRWERWVESVTTATGAAVTMEAQGVTVGPARIPVAVAYGGARDGVLQARPPLLGLAYSNIRWGQVMSDRANSLHKCGIPVPVIIGKLVGGPDGKAPGEVVMSSSLGLNLEEGGDAKILEPTGTSLEQARLELQDWEKRIAGQALDLLQAEGQAPQTATAVRTATGKERSKIGRALRSLEDAGELLLQYFCDYRGLDRETIDLTIRRDFGEVVAPETLQLLSALEERGQLTLSRLLIELKRAGAFGNDFDPAAEAEAVQRDQAAGSSGMTPEEMASQLQALMPTAA